MSSNNSAVDFLIQQLQSGRSKALINRIAAWVQEDKERVGALVEIFCGPDKKMAEYAAWVVGTLGYDKPAFFSPFLPQIVTTFSRADVHPALRRNGLRMIEKMDIPATLLDDITGLCFVLIDDPEEPVAVRAFAITILGRICEQIPELWPEMKLIMEAHIPHTTAAYQGRANKLIAKMTANK